MQRSGIMRQRAGMRGSTKKSIGGTTMMMNASICWLTFISLPTGCAASRRGPSPPLSGHPSAGRPNAPRPYRGVAAPDVPDASLVAEVRAHRLTVLSTPSRRRRYGTHPTVTTSSLISATPSASWDFAVERSLAIVDPQPAVTDRRYVTAPAPILPCDATGAATVHRARRDPRRVDSGDLRPLDVRAGHETVPVEDVGVDALVIMLVVMDLAILSWTTTRLGPTPTSNPRVASSWSSSAFVMRKSARPGSGTTRQPSCAGRQPCRSSAARLHHLATEHEAGPDHGRKDEDALRLLPEHLRVRLPYLEGVQLRGGIAIELGHGRGAGGRRAGRTGAVATMTRPDLE